MTRDEIIESLKAAPKRVVQVDESVHIFVGADVCEAVDRFIAKALACGHTVAENGISRWITVEPVQNLGKSGSARFVWHEDGERVRCARWLHSRGPNGEASQKNIGHSWKDFLAVA